MTEQMAKAADAMIERGSFYAEVGSIILAAVLTAFLVFAVRRMRSVGVSQFSTVIVGSVGLFAVYVLARIFAFIVFDWVYIPFAMNPVEYSNGISFYPLWVHPSSSRIAVLLSMLCSAVVFTILSRKQEPISIQSNAEELVRADKSSDTR